MTLHNRDITREQFEFFCAVLYILRGEWRMLPNDFPSWKLVYYYFRSKPDEDGKSLLDKILKKIGRS